jgi:SAM-dependent methyltransferase
MTVDSRDTLKADVRAHYAKAIRTSSCCGGGETASYGCGNPFAIAALKPGESVLDLGSGPGLDALLASRLVGPEGRVYALDMTDEMLVVALENVRKAGRTNVIFLRGDIESIPLPNDSVDVIISNCVVNLTPDKQRAAAEAFRVMRPGGRVAISDIVVDGDLSGFPLDEQQIRAGLSWAGCIAGALTTGDVATTFGAAGFVDVNVEILEHYSRQRLARRLSPEIAQLPADVVDGIARRFASSLISALKPHVDNA